MYQPRDEGWQLF